MKKITGVILKRILLLTGVVAALYAGLSVYYQNGFSCGTWINGLYCTGKTVAEVNGELLGQETYEKLTLLLPGGGQRDIYMDEVGYHADYTAPLMRIQAAQNPFLWLYDLAEGPREQTVAPEGSLDEKKFSEVFDSLDFVRETKPAEDCRVAILETADGYALLNERAVALDYEACKKSVRQAILRGEERLDLQREGCYRALPLDETMRDTLALWERLDAFLDCGIVYRFGEEEVVLGRAVVSSWLVRDGEEFVLDEKGNFLLDQEKMDAYVDALADRYDTLGSAHTFQATRGDVLTIVGGTYGNKMDREAEKAYLRQAIAQGKREVHEPAYVQEAAGKGREDVGDTYIEVDMGNQHLYYYEKGELKLDTPIVTGNLMRRRDTPSMVCYVYGKQKNRVLRGPGYASPVRFWMPVKGGIGIHDARWRSSFGGDIYKTDGSHGCINMPEEAMEQLYGMVEVGTPVVMFY